MAEPLRSTVRPQKSSGTVSIGTVLESLRSEFPDVTVSKIRFLEAEGLITPQRSPSGYRRFSPIDCERLRYVLTAQRDQYLPLKVIKERLERLDRGHNPDGDTKVSLPRHLVSAHDSGLQLQKTRQSRISLETIIEKTQVTESFIQELQKSRLITPGPSGFFTEDDVQLVIAVSSLARYGIEIRHLRTYKSTADRQADMIAQIASPRFKGHADSKARVEDLAHELMIETERLQKILLKVSLRKILS